MMPAMPFELSQIRHVVLDLDGTIYRGNRLLDATLPFLARLRGWGIGYTFLTNNTSRSKREYVEKLQRFGVDATESQIYTPADSTIAHLQEHLPDAKKLAVLGTPSLCQQFEGAGFVIDWEAPDAIVVGFDTTLTYDRLCKAAYWIAARLPYVATHPDRVCPTDEPTILVDCGSICACLAAATGRNPDIVLGKPDPRILLDLCPRLGIAPAQMAMVGDRVYTDVAMAQGAGVMAVLVLSGEAAAADAAALSPPADLVVADIGELGDKLNSARSGTIGN
jgi:HAD superfamily hydrolase (TIGR01450 family)